MKVAVVGSRNLNINIAEYLDCEVVTELVSGGARELILLLRNMPAARGSLGKFFILIMTPMAVLLL